MTIQFDLCDTLYLMHFATEEKEWPEAALVFDYHFDGTGQLKTSMDDTVPALVRKSLCSLLEKHKENVEDYSYCYLIQKRLH